MLTLEEAQKAILAEIRPLGPERVGLLAAAGRVLAHPLIAPVDHPPFDNSAMDGYAVRFAEVSEASASTVVELPVAFEVPAGVAPAALPVGAAARIMTGARMPVGADTVVMREDTTEGAAGVVGVRALPNAGLGAHIRRRGENFASGDRLLEPGAVVDAGAVGLMASCGQAEVVVRRRPRVAIVSTGDELVPLGQVPGPGQIINSSSYMLAAMVEAAGAEPYVLPIASDTHASTLETLQAAIAGSDLVLSIGGVSVGDYDVVKAVMEELCASLTFWKVRVKPGKPLAFGQTRAEGRPLIGLPGNPVSSYVAFLQFARPAIMRLSGRADLFLPRVRARLDASVRSTVSRLDLQRGALAEDGAGGYVFTPYASQGSGDPMSVVGARGLARIPIGTGSMKVGEVVEVDVIG